MSKKIKIDHISCSIATDMHYPDELRTCIRTMSEIGEINEELMRKKLTCPGCQVITDQLTLSLSDHYMAQAFCSNVACTSKCDW